MKMIVSDGKANNAQVDESLRVKSATLVAAILRSRFEKVVKISAACPQPTTCCNTRNNLPACLPETNEHHPVFVAQAACDGRPAAPAPEEAGVCQGATGGEVRPPARCASRGCPCAPPASRATLCLCRASPRSTKIGTKRIHVVRARGGNLKYRALRLETGTYSWGSEGACAARDPAPRDPDWRRSPLGAPALRAPHSSSVAPHLQALATRRALLASCTTRRITSWCVQWRHEPPPNLAARPPAERRSPQWWRAHSCVCSAAGADAILRAAR